MKKRITRQEIADRAGTSVSVVSRAINNSGYVEKSKKESILRIAWELGYPLQAASLSAAGHRSRQILYYCEDMRNPYNIHFYQGMLDAAHTNGYMILVNGSIHFDNLKNFFIDGIILPNENVARNYLEGIGKNYHLPIVCASYNDDRQLSRAVPLVELDMYQAVTYALDYLWSQGHQRIAFGTPESLSETGARNHAYRTWVRQKGLFDPERYFFSEPNPCSYPDFFELGRKCGERINRTCKEVTALLAFNDEFALGAMKGFRDEGLSVPYDISVMGIDGIYSRRYVSPLLTTINIMPEAQGRACMEIMLDILKGNKYKYITRTSFYLEKGESVMKIQEV